MVERIVPGPTLNPTATPVSRYVAPQEIKVAEDPLLEVARSLERINPQLQEYLQKKYGQYAEEEEAKGMNAESYVDPSAALQKNKDGWKSLIEQQRAIDKQNGTSYADQLTGASPHFRRGMVKAKVQRLSLALNDFLATSYERNPSVELNGTSVNLQQTDDPNAVSEWIRQQTSAFMERNGVNGIDPVLVAEVFQPRAAAAADAILSRHTEGRNAQYKQEYMDELSANVGLMLSTATGSSDADGFLNRLAGRESGNSYTASNNEVGSSGKRGHYGRIQFGHDRLLDAKRAGVIPMDMTPEQFMADTEAQRRAELWHIEDIDKHIQKNGYLDRGYSLDGLRAVAHLGGIGGLDKFVATGGAYNPSDSFGTSLSNYYNKFAGPALDLQGMLDGAVSDGMSTQDANEMVVTTVIENAIMSRNADMLSVLDDVMAGSGPLGNVGWVKKARFDAENQIAELALKEDEAAEKRMKKQRDEATLLLQTEATRAILADPTVDIQPYLEIALNNNMPELAQSLRAFRETVLEDDYKVRSDIDLRASLRNRVSSTNDPVELDRIRAEAMQAVTDRLLSSADYEGLMDDLDQRGRYSSIFDDDMFQQAMSDVRKEAGNRFGSENVNGEPIPSVLYASKAGDTFHQLVLDKLDEAGIAGKPTTSQLNRIISEAKWEVLDSREFTGDSPTIKSTDIPSSISGSDAPTGTDPTVTDAPAITPRVKTRIQSGLDSTEAAVKKQALALLDDLAADAGMTAVQFALANGINIPLMED
jgi:hypothetical protein